MKKEFTTTLTEGAMGKKGNTLDGIDEIQNCYDLVYYCLFTLLEDPKLTDEKLTYCIMDDLYAYILKVLEHQLKVKAF